MSYIYKNGKYYGLGSGGSSDSSANSDWDAKEGESGYIANKPFYEEKSDAFEVIIHDGENDADNLITLYNSPVYKISDTIIDEDIVSDCKIYLKVRGEDGLYEGQVGELNPDGNGNYLFEVSLYGRFLEFICIKNVPDQLVGSGISEGLYGRYNPDEPYIYKIEPPAYIKTLDEKFLPESAVSYRTVTVPESYAGTGMEVDYILYSQPGDALNETIILGNDLNVGQLTFKAGSEAKISWSYNGCLALIATDEYGDDYCILDSGFSDMVAQTASRILTPEEFKKHVSGSWAFEDEDVCNNIVIIFHNGAPYIEAGDRFKLYSLFHILTDYLGYRNIKGCYEESNITNDRLNDRICEVVDEQYMYVSVWNDGSPFTLYNVDARKKYVATKTKEEYEEEVISVYSDKLGTEIEELGAFDYLLPIAKYRRSSEYDAYRDMLKTYEVAYVESTQDHPTYYQAGSNNLPFRFGIGDDGNYGYVKNGEEKVTPFGVTVLRRPQYPEKMFDVIDEMAAKVAEDRGYYNPISVGYEYGYFKFSGSYYPNTVYSYNGGENSMHWTDSALSIGTVFKVTEIAYNGDTYNRARQVTFTDDQGITHIFLPGNFYNTDAVRLAGAPLPGMVSEDDVAPEAIHFTVTGGKLYLMSQSRADLIFALVQSTTSFEFFANSAEYYSNGSGYVATTHCTGAYSDELGDNNKFVISGDFDCRLYCTYSSQTGLDEITAIEIVDIGHNRTYRYEDVNGNFTSSFFEEDGWHYVNKFTVISDNGSSGGSGGSASGVTLLRNPQNGETMFDVIDEMAYNVTFQTDTGYEYGTFAFRDKYFINTSYTTNEGFDIHFGSQYELNNTSFKVTEYAYNGNNPARVATWTDEKGVFHIVHKASHCIYYPSEEDGYTVQSEIHFQTIGGKLLMTQPSRRDLWANILQGNISIGSSMHSPIFVYKDTENNGYSLSVHCIGSYTEYDENYDEYININGDFDCTIHGVYGEEAVKFEIVDLSNNCKYTYQDDESFLTSFFEQDQNYLYLHKFTKTDLIGEGSSSGGSATHVELTQAQYDALEVKDPDTIYFIRDENATNETGQELSVASDMSSNNSYGYVTGELVFVQCNVNNTNGITSNTTIIELPYPTKNILVAPVYLESTNGNTRAIGSGYAAAGSTDFRVYHNASGIISASCNFNYIRG